jgi:hypothetical protein
MNELIEFLDKYNVVYEVEGDLVVAGVVNLNSNYLTSLPESFGNIKCDWLNLSKSNLTSLPESFGNIKCDWLNLSYNNLTKLPESFGNIKCNCLNLGNNNLTKLPESFGNIKCDRLDLSNNNLTNLPESFGNVKCNRLYLYNNKLTSLPESFGNIKCNRLDLDYNNLTEFPKVRKFDEIEITDEYVYCDKILTWFDKVKKINEYTVYVGYFNNFVVTKDNEVFAHSKSIRQGVSDLLFKLSDRDAEKYKSIDLDEQIPIEQAIVMYRTITGACSYGVESFMKGKEFSETISVNEIMDIIGNQYGSVEFKEFFNKI